MPIEVFCVFKVSDESQVQEAIRFAKEKCGYINVAVNCAGVATAKKTIGKDGKAHSLEEFEKVLKV